jgi:DNA-binding transcriptional ArsR family regulator
MRKAITIDRSNHWKETKLATKAQRRKAAQNRLKAMSHDTRAKALRILTERTASPAEIAREIGEKVENVSYHVKKMAEWGVVKPVGERKAHGAGAIQHFYRATVWTQIDAAEWEEMNAALTSDFLGDIGQKMLADIAESLDAGLLGKDKNFHLTRTRMAFDEQGRDEALEIAERARKEILQAQARAKERMAESGESSVPYSSIQGFFEVPAP